MEVEGPLGLSGGREASQVAWSRTVEVENRDVTLLGVYYETEVTVIACGVGWGVREMREGKEPRMALRVWRRILVYH
jgi:hypothetical protein